MLTKAKPSMYRNLVSYDKPPQVTKNRRPGDFDQTGWQTGHLLKCRVSLASNGCRACGGRRSDERGGSHEYENAVIYDIWILNLVGLPVVYLVRPDRDSNSEYDSCKFRFSTYLCRQVILIPWWREATKFRSARSTY